MKTNFKVLPLMVCSMLGLQACQSGDSGPTIKAPNQLVDVGSELYARIRTSSEDADTLFKSFGATESGDELCDVKIHRMIYDTVGGAGESTTSSGVFMLPHGDDPACSGPRPVVLYAHGTSTDRGYDLSQMISNSSNDAAGEGMLLLAAYASNGYAVIAPNYAGYSFSSLGYHPYLDELQQSTEMMDALDHVRKYSDEIGADLSSELFIAGASQGGYVAMATHKALEAKGETVTASLPISGPYAILDYFDALFAGYVSGGATQYSPMVLTAMQKSDAIYSDPSEVYDAAYADFAENSLPRTGGFAASGLPATALFSGEAPEDANPLNQMGFGDDHLLSDDFRALYLSDLMANGDTPVYPIRALVAERDMRDWQPAAPTMLCGASTDPVVYYSNTTTMTDYWAANPYVSSFDVTNLPSWQAAEVPTGSIHGQTGVFCTGVGLQFFANFR
jgi:hypothetical protein